MAAPNDPRAEEAMKRAMQDVGHFSQTIKPNEDNPDAPVSFGALLAAIVTCPGAPQLPAGTTDLDPLHSALDAADALDADAMNAWKMSGEAARRSALLLLYKLNQQRPGFEVALEDPAQEHASRMLAFATKLLMQAQVFLPQARWVQQTLSVARASALIANSLWSHTDEAALALMSKILDADGLPPPKLSLTACAYPKGGTPTDSVCEVLPKGHVTLDIKLTREHAGPGKEGVSPPNPQGIWEAYWLYVEGQKPEGTPNSLIVAQPIVVKDLEDAHAKQNVVFGAPPDVGDYKLTVYVVSTSVIGIDINQVVEFKVVEDDVPDLA